MSSNRKLIEYMGGWSDPIKRKQIQDNFLIEHNEAVEHVNHIFNLKIEYLKAFKGKWPYNGLPSWHDHPYIINNRKFVRPFEKRLHIAVEALFYFLNKKDTGKSK